MSSESELSEAYKGRPVLVTGGAGFIGSHLVEGLVHLGARVRVLDDLSSGSRSNLEAVLPDIEFIEGDIRDGATCLKAAKNTDIIFHQAALVSVPASIRDPAKTYRINIEGTSNVFEAAREAATTRVVYASSSAVYGDCSELPLVETRCGRLLSPYAVSKRADELIAEFGHTLHGTTSVGLRYFNVFGPRQSPDSPYAAVIPIFLSKLRANQPPTVFGDGSQTRDFVSVRDVVRANLLAGIARNVESAVVNVGSGISTTVASLARDLCAIIGQGLVPRFEAARPGDIAASVADTRLAQELLGFCTTVELHDGLVALVGRG